MRTRLWASLYHVDPGILRALVEGLGFLGALGLSGLGIQDLRALATRIWGCRVTRYEAHDWVITILSSPVSLKP